MVDNRDNKITNHINQNQCSSHHKERIAQYIWNSEVFLVPFLYVDGLNIARQNVE